MDIRSFLAFELPPEIKKILTDTSKEMKKRLINLRWVKVENIHLTVIFLGNFPLDSVDSAGNALGEICERHAPFRIQLKGIGTFGGRQNPRVLWAGIEGDLDRIGALRDQLQGKLAEFGIEKESRKYKPHLTLARFKKGSDPEMELPRILSEFKDINSSFCMLEELLFLRSDLKPAGAVYTKLKAWPLKGNA